MKIDNITEAEKKFLYWQFKMSGSFFKCLFDCMAQADPKNLTRIAAGFPDEVKVYQRFANEKGYWVDLKKRAEINE